MCLNDTQSAVREGSNVLVHFLFRMV